MSQYLVICYQHEAHSSFIVDDLKEFIKEYSHIDDPNDEYQVQKAIDWLLNTYDSEHEVYEVIDGKLHLISKAK